MRIAFVLPMPTYKIVGGYKMVYEYANYLSDNGYDVTIIYNANKGKNAKKIPRLIVYVIRYYLGKKGPFWFQLNRFIKRRVLYSISSEKIQKYDILVATAADTAKVVSETSAKKLYFVQDFEDWNMKEEELFLTYNYDMHIITVANWLERKIREVSNQPITYISNGIDIQIFNERKEYKSRKRHSIAMLYHRDIRKGCDIGIEILFQLKKQYTDLEVYMFGSPERNINWPAWISYTRNASQKEVSEIMNRASIFLCTSRVEGFGLTGLESMFCGCVLVTTDCKGIREYADESNSFIADVDDVQKLYNNVSLAFEDYELCCKKKEMAKKSLDKFMLNNSKKHFLELLNSI